MPSDSAPCPCLCPSDESQPKLLSALPLLLLLLKLLFAELVGTHMLIFGGGPEEVAADDDEDGGPSEISAHARLVKSKACKKQNNNPYRCWEIQPCLAPIGPSTCCLGYGNSPLSSGLRMVGPSRRLVDRGCCCCCCCMNLVEDSNGINLYPLFFVLEELTKL